MMKNVIWNPVNPEMTYKKYEKHVEEVIERQVNTTGFLSSIYKNLVNDFELLGSLEQPGLQKRTDDTPKWEGASGYCHQIDISFSTEDERVILLIECKHWAKSVDFPNFSAFLIRVIDIATFHRNSTVLGMLVTTQGMKGKTGGTKKDQDCIANIQRQFGKMGYYVTFHVLPD